MIREIRRYITERGTVTLQDISIHFRMDETALEPLLAMMEQEGYIKVDRQPGCSSCLKACPFAGSKPQVLISDLLKNC